MIIKCSHCLQQRVATLAAKSIASDFGYYTAQPRNGGGGVMSNVDDGEKMFHS